MLRNTGNELPCALGERTAAGISLLMAAACNSLLNIGDAQLICEGSRPCASEPGDAAIDEVVPAASSSGEADAGLAPIDASAIAPNTLEGSRATGSEEPLAMDTASGSAPAAGDTTGDSTDMVPPPPVAGVTGPVLGPDGLALALPDDLLQAPVAGELVFADDAVWEVNGVFQPTFEIHTPTASYWIVKSLGTMVSMEDGSANATQWIAFSSGFRPLRGVPSFVEPPTTTLATVRDEASQTPTHTRLTAESGDGAWQWVWDFYVTHVTFTLNRAPGQFGFGYRGVPGGSLGTEDQLVLADGTSQGARNSFAGDVPGPTEWAYLADTTLRRSIFLVQHTDDAVAERYQVRDNDSASWLFGDGQLVTLPIRFSVGLIDSTEHTTVAERVAFISNAIR